MFSPLINLASRNSQKFFSLKRQRFDALTGLRAVAAAMVFVYHNRKFWYGWLPDPLMRFFNEFHLGVAVFFVLSGFVIGYTYNEKPLQSKADYRKYILVRFARIMPMYLIFVTLEFFRTGFPSGKEIIVAYTLTQGFFDDYILNGLPQAWTLTVEMTFYILAPFLFFRLKKNISKTFFWLLLSLFISISIGMLLNHLHWNKAGFMIAPLMVLNNTFFGRFFEFGCGLFLSQVILKQRSAGLFVKWKNQTLWGGLAVLFSIYLIALFQKQIYTNGGDTIGGAIIRNTLFALSMMIFIHGLLKERTWVSRFLSTKVLVILGNASFIFYLIHLKAVNYFFWYWHIFPDRNFCLLWIVSIAAYYLIERPLYDRMKRIIMGKKKVVAMDPLLAIQEK